MGDALKRMPTDGDLRDHEHFDGRCPTCGQECTCRRIGDPAGFHRVRYAGLVAHIREARKRLRIECALIGDNDWPDTLHLADVIDKHFARPAAARIAELEEKLSKYRRIVAVPVDSTYTAHLWVPADIDVETERERWKSSDSFAPFTNWLISHCSAEWANEVEEMEADW